MVNKVLTRSFACVTAPETKMNLPFLSDFRARVAHVTRAEDGNVATFCVLLFALMVMVGGLAVDLMRYEHTRTGLQQTLDRCTLAATALRQSLDAESVCRE